MSGADGRTGGGVEPGDGLATIEPRTTLYQLLMVCPPLREQLISFHSAFARLADDGPLARRWARVTSLDDVARELEMPWRRLAQEIRACMAREGCQTPALGSPGVVAQDDRRLVELRAIAGELEEGGDLLGLSEKVRRLTADMSAADAAALERALAEGAERSLTEAGERALRAARTSPFGSPPPPGHPLDTQSRSAAQLRLLARDLGGELERLGGSPSRRRWRSAKPMVRRLVDRLAQAERMFQRHQQAWFPALAIHGVEGPGTLLSGREAEALEVHRRVHLAVERDDTAVVAEAGASLVQLVSDLLGTMEQIVVPLAERHLSEGDWVVVRELEDDVGFALIPEPPPWPGPRRP